ncbi:hypothetical protein PA25_32160 [Pseudoalteromonas sp. A25]|uniref:hypothetical protein n=1 Tax=Pseudoalteromonas sp. A25 TaxID=116092 RepID=UPI001260B984|nr:hypothetical protein [Pseudoalteromonas sp. A25]BBN83231.1 hypothetical protein PA25_32160 [Pseudoalteromonas sp. A25]
MYIAYSLLALSLSSSPVRGELVLQEPAREFYYSTEPGVVVHQFGLAQGDKVAKGQALLTYMDIQGNEEKTVTSKASGYLEFVSDVLMKDHHFSAGEMLFKVKSSLVLGWYSFKKEPEAQQPIVNSKLWICSKGGHWHFNVDAVKADRVLLSSVVGGTDFAMLYELSRQKGLKMYPNKYDCLKNLL